MMSRLIILFLLLSALSCRKEDSMDCFKRNGAQTTEARQPGTFDRVDIKDNFEVHVYKSSVCSLEVVGGANVVKSVETKLEGRTLTLINNNKCNFVRGYKRHLRINLYLPHLEYLQNDNVGVVWFDEKFSQDSISVLVASSGDIHLTGEFRVVKSSSNSNGDMYLSGKTKKLFVFTTGVNYVWAGDLSVSDYMFIHTVTMGDCHINANGTGQFDYNIQKSGNIYYKGEPGSIHNFSEPDATGRLLKE